jgi:hypothetical protein
MPPARVCRNGIEPLYGHPAKRWANSLKLVTTFEGFEVARPLDPLVRMVGPILTRSNPQASTPLL